MNFKFDEVIMNSTDEFNPIKTSEAEAALYMEAVVMYLGETFLYFSELSRFKIYFIREVLIHNLQGQKRLSYENFRPDGYAIGRVRLVDR